MEETHNREKINADCLEQHKVSEGHIFSCFLLRVGAETQFVYLSPDAGNQQELVQLIKA